jgi:two-component system, cell cycle response regulator CpdR
LRILYVEDNSIVREVTSELLADERRQVVALGSAEEAMETFAQNSFDVLITDVSLPRMSGIDLTRKILALRPQLPIIIASGYSLGCALKEFGPNVRSIIKPFEARDIDGLIDEIVPAR